MSSEQSRYRWFVVAVFFFFMLLHQTDKLMIGSLQVQISNDFNINNKQWGLINSGALIVATILYPIWGYLYDRYSRTKLLSLASFIWGATTWLNAIVRSFGGFLATRASTGIDDSSYPGLYTLIADYFGPTQRGKIFGILQLAQPLGYLLGMILALMVAPAIGGWRSVFYITGSLGVIIALLIFFGVKEMPRGKAEPEFENMTEMQTFKFSWAEAKEIFKKKTMWFVFLQGFAGVFPWNVITFFFFAYLEKERGYDANGILFTMAPVILILASGYFIGGALGDFAFKRTNKGRIIVSCIGVLMGALFMYLAITTPIEAKNQFFVFMCLTAIFMPLSATNVTATVYDVTVPEVRSTAQAVEYFIENAGAAFAPIITGVIADMYDLKTAILLICTVAWGLCFIFYLGAIFTIDKDSHDLRNQMAERAKSM
ncbi:MAG: MFS transporter [Anaerolineales bacterium]|uniref:spinster family MFS transporter n=1 Tax=Candidatus Villigracilis vicinus TaxID=3140679 RepID=UPI003134B5AE|nr:MFS transporter [Anaerolineales bacterium]MBK9780066.1 MFS transporter [Anaerolineales bacterium]